MADSNQSIFSDAYSKYTGAKQKRKEARVKLDIPCSIQLVKVKSQSVSGFLVDLGTGGLAFNSTTIFYEGDLVTVKFSLNKQDIELQGNVQRSHGKITSIIFHPLSKVNHLQIQEYIHKHYFDPKGKK